VREAAAITRCTNNLKQLGLACHNYHDSAGVLPPTANTIAGISGTAHFFLLPYLEQSDLYNSANGNCLNVKEYTVPNFVCPLDPSVGVELNNCIINSSTFVSNVPSAPVRSGLAATSYAINSAVTTANGPASNDGYAHLVDITAGTSNTVLFAERYTNCYDSGPHDFCFWAAGPNMSSPGC
jgi:hypothetical protein